MKKLFLPVVLLLALLVPTNFYALDEKKWYELEASYSDPFPTMQFYYTKSVGDATNNKWTFISQIGGFDSYNTYTFKKSTFPNVNPNYYIEFTFYLDDENYIPALCDFTFEGSFFFYGPKVGDFQASKITKAQAWFIDYNDNVLGQVSNVNCSTDSNGKTTMNLSGYNLQDSNGVKIRLFFNVLDCTTNPLSNFTSDTITIESGSNAIFRYAGANYFGDTSVDELPNLSLPPVDDSGMIDIDSFIPDVSNPLMIILSLFTNLDIIKVYLILVSVIGTVAYILFGKR